MTAPAPLLRRLDPDDPAMPAVHALIVAAFAGMDGRIDPPSSIHRTGPAELSAMAAAGAAWVIGAPPVACLFAEPRGQRLYLGKLAVAEEARGHGLARRLIAAAEAHARALGCTTLELQTRVELTENHRAFSRMGFTLTAATAHPGFDRPTSLTFTLHLDPAGGADTPNLGRHVA